MKDDTEASFENAAQFHKLVASLKAEGWPLGPVVTRTETTAGARVYLCDVESSTLHLIVLAKDTIEQTMAEAKVAGFSLTPEEVQGASTTLFAHLADSKADPTEEENRYAGVVIAFFLAGTNVYTMAKAQINSAHFVIVRYRCVKTGTYWHRTVAAIGPEQFSPAEVEKLANRALAGDRKRCPERFPRTTVVEFRARS